MLFHSRDSGNFEQVRLPKAEFQFEVLTIESVGAMVPAIREQVLLGRYLLCRENLAQMSVSELEQHQKVYQHFTSAGARYNQGAYFEMAAIAHPLLSQYPKDAHWIVRTLLSCSDGIDAHQSFDRDRPALNALFATIKANHWDREVLKRRVSSILVDNFKAYTLSEAAALAQQST